MRRLSRRSGAAAEADLLHQAASRHRSFRALPPGEVGPQWQDLPTIQPLDVEEPTYWLEPQGDFLANSLGAGHASAVRMHGIPKRIVYILRSGVDPSRHYVGITNDLVARLEWHNHGPCGHTRSYRPWSVVVSLEFPTEKEAVRFEKYLKSGSGRAFAARHFGRCD
jgi:putative endonuclease